MLKLCDFLLRGYALLYRFGMITHTRRSRIGFASRSQTRSLKARTTQLENVKRAPTPWTPAASITAHWVALFVSEGKLFRRYPVFQIASREYGRAIRRDASVRVRNLGYGVGEPLNFHRRKSRYCFRRRYIRSHKFKIDAGCWGHFQTLWSIWPLSRPCWQSFAAGILLPSFDPMIFNRVYKYV